jgi:hypothetical protein
VRITANEVEWLKQTWARQWQRPPSDEELMGLVAGYLKETLLAREARALGLDESDTVVRRRRRSKHDVPVCCGRVRCRHEEAAPCSTANCSPTKPCWY